MLHPPWTRHAALSHPCCGACSLPQVILGTQYAGEMKKGVFTLMNYMLPKFVGRLGVLGWQTGPAALQHTGRCWQGPALLTGGSCTVTCMCLEGYPGAVLRRPADLLP